MGGVFKPSYAIKVKNDFLLIIMGASPQTPEVLRFEEPRIIRACKAIKCLSVRSFTWRSGRSSALPYPPSEWIDDINKTIIYIKNSWLEKKNVVSLTLKKTKNLTKNKKSET